MKRRQFLAGLGALAVSRAGAQTPARAGKPVRVGLFFTSPPGTLQLYVIPFIEAMRELGWVEGRNVVYDYAYSEVHLTDLQLMRAHAATLVSRAPDVIWLIGTVNATVAHAVTRSIPLVGSAVSNVIENGLVKSLSRPGSNFTGITNIDWQLGGKRFQLLHELMPRLSRVGVLVNPANENSRREQKLVEQAAAAARVTVIPAMVEREEDIDAAFAHLEKNKAEAVLITHLPIFQNHRKRILELAAKQRIPAIGHRSFFVDDGALMAYSSVLSEQMRRSAHLVDKILKGTRPGDIPVEQPTRFELVINLKTAKALGLALPHLVVSQADRVIE